MFKRSEPQKKTSPEAEELKELIAQARQEGKALTGLADKLNDRSSALKTVSSTLAKVEAAATQASSRLEALQGRVAQVETVTASVGELDTLVKVLQVAVKEATGTVERLVSPEGELQKQREVAQQLSAASLYARTALDEMKTGQATLEKLRTDLRQTLQDLQKSREEAAAASAEVRVVRTTVTDLSREHGQIRETSRQSRDDAAAALATLADIEVKLAGMNRMQELARTLEERVAALNGSVEHVIQRSKVLDQQKHTVERAIIEGHRLSGMLTAMEGQIARLDEGRRQTAAVEDTVDRIEQIVRESSQQLDEAGRRRDLLAADLERLDRDRASLLEFVAKHEERLETQRLEMQASQARAAAIDASVQGVERTQASVLARDRELADMAQRIAALDAQLMATVERADDAGRKIEVVEVLKQDLLRVDEMARRATWQMESLKSARADLDELRGELQAFYREHADAAQLRDKLSADRVALEGFLDRASAFAVSLPELDARLNAVRARLASVDEDAQKAANLVAIADDLDRQMGRLTGYQQFVERIEGRLNGLQTLTTDVDRKIEEQITRRGEIDALRSLCDGVSMQVNEIRQKLGGISQVHARLQPVAEQVTSLKQAVDKAEARLTNALRSETELGEQERRIADMLRSVRELAGAADTRLNQAQSLTEALARSEKVKDGLVQELSVVQGRQREVSGQLETAESQMKHLDGMLRQLEERRQQVAFAEKRMTAFESGVAALKGATDEVESRLEALGQRQEVLEALRKEVEGVRELSAQSKADLDHLQAHRADVLSLRAQVDELLANMRTTEERMTEIQARRRMVEEVQLKVNVITSMLDDVRLSLETVGTQRAIIDHALGDLARLETIVQTAERTLKSLQNERELAEHIERSIQLLRARTTLSDAKKRA